MCYSLWYNVPTMLPACGRQHRRYIIPQAVTHSLVLLKMGKIIARNMLSWLELLLLSHLVGCLYYLYQWCTVKQISDNEIYLLIKYVKILLWRVAKRLPYIQDARCLKVNRRYSEVHMPRTSLTYPHVYELVCDYRFWMKVKISCRKNINTI